MRSCRAYCTYSYTHMYMRACHSIKVTYLSPTWIQSLNGWKLLLILLLAQLTCNQRTKWIQTFWIPQTKWALISLPALKLHLLPFLIMAINTSPGKVCWYTTSPTHYTCTSMDLGQEDCCQTITVCWQILVIKCYIIDLIQSLMITTPYL